MRISRIGYQDAAEPLRDLYDRWYQQRGNVPNMFRVMAHRPELLRTLERHFHCVMQTGTVSTALKELLAVRVSQLNHCEY